MRRACDPAVFLFIFLHNQGAGFFDNQHAVLQQVDDFAAKRGLEFDQQTSDGLNLYENAASIDIKQLGQPDYRLLFRARTEFTEPPSGTFYECLGYVYRDTIVIQITIGKFSDWSGSITDGWVQLVDDLRASFSSRCLDKAEDDLLGLSTAYWAIAEGHNKPNAYEEEVLRIVQADARRSETDLGPLWRSTCGVYRKVLSPQDSWVLVTARQAEEEVERRYHEPATDSPPPFVIMALAQHKISFENQQFATQRDAIENARAFLEQVTFSVMKQAGELEEELDELRSERSTDFQRKLGREACKLAEFRNQIGRIDELRRTILINRRNYLIHAIPLISSGASEAVENSTNQEQAALEFLNRCQEDGIFRPRLGIIQGMINQLDSDLHYANSLISRASASFRAASDQLRIAVDRNVGEIAHHISVDSAAVVASLAAILMIELVVKPSHEKLAAGEMSQVPAPGLLALSVITASFAATQLLSSGGRGKRLEAVSVAVTAECFAGWLCQWVADWVSRPRPHGLGYRGLPVTIVLVIVTVAISVAAFWFGLHLHSRLANRPRQKARAKSP